MGEFTCENTGNRYEGTMIGNKKSGFGEMTYANGNKYFGQWLHDKMTGKGVFYDNQAVEKVLHPTKFKYIGTFKDGYLEGPGEIEMTNQSRDTQKFDRSYKFKYYFKKFDPQGKRTISMKI